MHLLIFAFVIGIVVGHLATRHWERVVRYTTTLTDESDR